MGNALDLVATRILSSDARTTRNAVDIIFDVFDAVDLTYLTDRTGKVAALADGAAQCHRARNNSNVDSALRRKRVEHGANSRLD